MSADPSAEPRVDLQGLRTRLRAEEKKLALMQEIGQALSSALDLDSLLALIMEKITTLMEADRSTLYLLTDDGTELWSKVVHGGERVRIRLRVGEGIAGWVAQSCETVNIPDAYNDTRFQPAFDNQSGYRTRSILCMPMRNHRGVTIGVIQVLNKAGGPFTAEDESLLAALAGTAAVSIENSKLYHSVVQRSTELNILYDIEAEVNAAHSLDEILDRLLKRAVELLGAGAGAIALRERGTDELLFRSVVGPVSDKLHRARTSMSKGILGWVSAQRQPLIVQEPQRDGRHDRELADLLGYIPRNLICVPLIAESDVMGALELLDKKDARPFDENDRKLLSLIAGQVSRAIQLARAKEERINQGRLASIGQMLSGVLHDLKTPMTIVSGYAQLMAQIDDGEQRAAYVEQILKQFDHMGAMTREVLAFAKGESNVLVRKVFLHKFLDEVASHLQHEFAGKGIQLDMDGGFRGTAYFDEQKMLRVVHNIARNAAQAMSSGGSFRVGTKVDGDRLVFDFTDTGPGIPPEMEGRLFELFATSGKKDGTGLGLAIVKKIVDEHHGKITYETQAGVGTTFTIALPTEKPQSAERTGEFPSIRPPGANDVAG